MNKTLGDTISISTARANLPKIVEDVVKYLRRFTITVNGQPQAVVISQQELDAMNETAESMEETAEILAIPGALEDIREGIRQIKAGKFVTLEQLKIDLQKKRIK